MPRQPVKTAVEVFNVLKDKHIFHPDGSLKKEKYVDQNNVNVWNDASELLSPMSAHHIYIMVFENRKNLQTDLKKHFFPQTVKEISKPEKQCADISKGNACALENVKENPVEITNNLPDEYTSIVRMKFDVRYHSTIQEIGVRPFAVTLKSPEHKDTFKVLVDADCSMGLTTIDTVAANTKLKKYTSSNSHLVSLVSKVEKHIVILCQRVSEKMKCRDVQFLLLNILKGEDMHLPSEFFVPYHEGILDNVCRALNTCTFDAYSAHSLEYLQNRRSSLPPVLLNIDLMSILMKVAESEYFKNLLPVVQKFYIKCIIYLKFVKNLEEFKSTVTSMFICLFSPYDDENVEKQKQILDTKLEKEEVLDVYKKFLAYRVNGCTNLNMFNGEKFENLKVSTYIEDLKGDACINSNVGLPNGFGCIDWYDGQLKYLLSSFTSWTGVLLDNKDVDFVNYACNKQKELLTDNRSTVEFVSNIIMQSRESMRTGISILNNRKRSNSIEKKKKKQKNDKQIFHKCEENWRGKNNCYKATKNLSSEITQDDIAKNVEVINVLKNSEITESTAQSTVGSLLTPKPILVDTVDLTADQDLVVKNSFQCGNIEVKQPYDFESLEIVIETDEGYKNHELVTGIDEGDKSDNLICSEFIVENVGVAQDQNLVVQNSFQCDNIGVKQPYDIESMDIVIETDEESKNLELVTGTQDAMSSSCGESGDGFKPVDSSSKHSEELSKRLHTSTDHDYASVADVSPSISAQSTVEDAEINGTSTSKHVQKFELSLKTSIDDNERENATQMDKCFFSSPHKPEMVNVRTKGSKYIRAAPTMEMTHLQSAANKNEDNLIHNATGLGGRKIKGCGKYKYTIEDSSKFDVFAEIFSFAFKNYMTFKEMCLAGEMCFETCKTECFFQIIKQYCIDGSMPKLYQNRAEFLYKYANANSETRVINIEEDISQFFKTLMTYHFSFSMQKFCTLCNKVSKSTTQKVCSIKILPSQKLSDLEVILKSHLESKWGSHEFLCPHCSASSEDDMSLYFFWEPYLCVDIEGSNVIEFVNTAPQFIHVPNGEGEEKIKYALAGVVTSDPTKDSMYMAYCQTLKQHWDVRNGIKRSIKNVSQLPKTKIALLLYIRTIDSTLGE